MGQTGLGKYQAGMELEALGVGAAEVAKRLGYKSAASWQATKAYYKKRHEDMLARCQPKTGNAPETDTLLGALPPRIPVRRVVEAETAVVLSTTPEHGSGGSVASVAADGLPARPGKDADTLRGADIRRTVPRIAIAERVTKLVGETAEYRLTEDTLRIRPHGAGDRRSCLKIAREDLPAMIEELIELRDNHC